jgi:O-antigen/teichoic acid export membrane protein
VAEGIAAATPGLFCFALNKLLLGVVNGLRRMRAFAVYQSLRYLLLLLGFSLAGELGVSGERLSFVWTFAEGILLIVLAIEVAGQVAWRQAHAWRQWVRAHVVYGFKSVLSAMMLELNARIDIWMLGAYLDDAAVGIYSLAAILAEGVYQLMVVLQNNFNPLLARLIAAGETAELERMVRRARRWIVPSMLGVGLLAALVYPWTVPLFTERPEFAQSSASFAILVGGIALASGWLPFSQTLLMAGKPGWHTLYMALVVLTNVVFNALLIPHLGINGAAIGTAVAFIASAVLLRVFVKRLVGVRL